MRHTSIIKSGMVKLAAASLSLALASTAVQAEDHLKISTKGGLKIETPDGKASFKLGGRIQWDYDNTETDDGSVESETFEVRRARLAAKGNYENWGYKAQFNLGEDDGGSSEDLYITYNGWGKAAKLTVGKHKEPLGLEEMASSKDITLLERSGITELYAAGRNAGIQLSGKGSNLFYALGLYRDDGTDPESIDETAVTGRVAFAPVNESGRVIHLGLGYRAGDMEDIIGLELAAVLGQFHAQAEFFEADEADIDGSYVQLGYVLSGSPRPYKDGKFKRVAPTDGMGIEFAVRVEQGTGKYSDVGIGTAEGNQTSIGVNLYPNKNVRLGLSFMTGELDDTEDEGDEIRFRTQFTF